MSRTDDGWRITRGGRRYETMALAAARLKMAPGTLVKAIRRAKLEPDDHLDERTPVYRIGTLDRMLADRPGKGARGMARKGASA